MNVTNRMWFAVSNGDGTYGEPHPLGTTIPEFVGIERPERPSNVFESHAGTVNFGRVRLSKYARRLFGIDPWPVPIWELRKRGKRSRKNRRKRHVRRQ